MFGAQGDILANYLQTRIDIGQVGARLDEGDCEGAFENFALAREAVLPDMSRNVRLPIFWIDPDDYLGHLANFP